MCCPWCDAGAVAFQLFPDGVRIACSRVAQDAGGASCPVSPYIDAPTFHEAIAVWRKVCTAVGRFTNDGYEFTSYVPLYSAQPHMLSPILNLATHGAR